LTTIAFTPVDGNISAPPFQATVQLDTQPYNLVAAWNQYRQDWYVQLVDQGGNVVCNQPLVGSPPNYVTPLFPGLFVQSLIYYDVASGTFVVTP
jgi:hypothetical protein